MGLAGVVKTTRAGEPSRPVIGLRGIMLAVAGNLSVKVTDYAGRNMAGVRITTAQGQSYFTDSMGNAFILVTGTNVVLTLSKYKVSRSYNVPNGTAQVAFTFDKPLGK